MSTRGHSIYPTQTVLPVNRKVISQANSTNAEVVDKIVSLEDFEYWKLTGNWKPNGKRGFVYKDKIKEKL